MKLFMYVQAIWNYTLKIWKGIQQIMSDLDTLKKAVADIGTAAAAAAQADADAATAIQSAIAQLSGATNAGGISPADAQAIASGLETVATGLSTNSANLETAATALNGVVNPPAASAPTGGTANPPSTTPGT